MLFNSFEFLLFLPLVFLLYWFVFNRNLKLQNVFIVIVSYIFYGWWNWTFLLLIAITSLCSYVSGIAIQKTQLRGGGRKLTLILNTCINLLILGVYKYYDFFVNSFVTAFQQIGIHLESHSLGLVLPVGISFYTFQALSYTIDVYKGKLQPTKDLVSFLAFISFFPQLVAGPIERATNLLPQFMKMRTFNYSMAIDGMRQILWGFFKKVVIADSCATLVNQIFDNYQHESGSTLLLGAIYFTFQIYGDFSGYSDIAIGTAKLFGISLMRNFNLPYFSRDIAEFWRRWHISLTTWFRDYIYIPLGGSRVSKLEVIRNTFIIFLISGFWHGANWTFVTWGLYHALLFLPLLIIKKNRKHTDTIAMNRYFPSFTELTQMLLTFFLVVFGWIIFRAANIHEAYYYITRMLTNSLFTIPAHIHMTTISFILIMLLIEWINRTKEHGLVFTEGKTLMLTRYAIYFCLLFLIYFFAGNQGTFIYFQF